METLDARLDKRDWGIELRKKIASALSSRFRSTAIRYEPLPCREDDMPSVEMTPSRGTSLSSTSAPPAPNTSATKRRPRYTQRLPFRRIFTRNVSMTLLSHSLLAFHVGTFNSLWFIFFSTPVFDPADPAAPQRYLPFVFTGGLGLPPARVGVAMSILGFLGISLQLFVYPTLSARLGTVRCLRLFLLCFPVTYFLMPYLSIVPSSSSPPEPKSGPAIWLAIAVVLCCQVIGRTFALPNSVSGLILARPILLLYTLRSVLPLANLS